jgi:hypothetical protein
MGVPIDPDRQAKPEAKTRGSEQYTLGQAAHRILASKLRKATLPYPSECLG